jgi:hypothetical protein
MKKSLIILSLFYSIHTAYAQSTPKTPIDRIPCEKAIADQAPTNVIWQWENNKDAGFLAPERRPLVALERLPDDKDDNLNVSNSTNAFSVMLEGQSHNKSAQDTYYKFIGCYGDIEFWHMVAGTSRIACNINEAERHINWQKANDYDSIGHARSELAKGRNLKAMYWLLKGQNHTDGQNWAWPIYRACFNSNKGDLFGLVNK